MSDKFTVDDILAEFDNKKNGETEPTQDTTEKTSDKNENVTANKYDEAAEYIDPYDPEGDGNITEVLNPDITEWNDLAPSITAGDIESAVNEELEAEILEEDEASEGNSAEAPVTVEDGNDEEITDDTPEEENLPPENSEETPENTAEENTEAQNLQEEPDCGEKENKSFFAELFPHKGDSVFEIVRKIVFIAAVTVFIGAGIMLASTLVQSSRAVKDLEDNKNRVTTTAKTTIGEDGSVITLAPTKEDEKAHNLDIMSYYKEISENVIGFIELEGCDIYQPVVQKKDDTKNEYYLTRTYYDETNKGGAIFMDYRCTVSEDYVSPNLVLYGHNQEDGTMFGNLKNYKQNLEFYAENPTVTLRTDYEAGTYLIYAFFVTNALENQDSNGEVFHYHDYIEALNDESTFDWYMSEVQSRNQIISPVKAEFGDKLLVLSTCSNEFSNSRFVVFARKLRDNESVNDYDFNETYFNPNARGVDWGAILSGETITEPPATVSETEATTTRNKKRPTGETTVTANAPEISHTRETEAPEETKVTAETTAVPVREDETETTTVSRKKKRPTGQ